MFSLAVIKELLKVLWGSRLFRYLSGLLIILVSLYGLYHVGYSRGVEYQKVYDTQQEAKAKVVALQKVQQIQSAVQTKTDQAEKTQIVYKDRIVTEYVPIEKKVTEYAQKENENPANVTWINSSFVRLFNDAATGGTSQDQTTRPASKPSGEATKPTEDNPSVSVSSGQVLQVITENDKQYQQCVRELNGWQDWYKQLQDEYNK